MDLDVSGSGPKKMSGLRHTAVSGFKWTALSQSARLGAQLLSLVILARFLPPSDYGLAAMGAVVTGFASLFRDFGTAAAIIQKKTLTTALLNSLFWLNVAIGVALALLIGTFAPFIAMGFGESRLTEVLWAMALIFPMAALATVHQALMEKASRFRPLAIIEAIAAIVSLSGAIWAAQAGWGVFSLVLQTLLATALTTVCVWKISPWRPSFHWDTSEIRSVMNFSGNLVGFNIFNYFARNADNFLIGRFLGATDLGYYSMAYRLMLWPLQNISSVVGRALFPVFSVMQSDRSRLAHAYVRATAAITLITAPLMFGFFVLREPLVIVVLGERWQPVTDILLWLVPVGLMQSIGATVGSLYLATGRTDLMFKWGIAAGLLVIPAFVIGMQWGVIGVAIAYAFASVLLFWPSLAIPLRLVGLGVGHLLKRVMPSLLSAAAMACIVALIAAVWPASSANQMLRLLVLISVGLIAYGGISLFSQRGLLKNMMHAVLNR